MKTFREIREINRLAAETNQVEFSKEDNVQSALSRGFILNPVTGTHYNRADLKTGKVVQIRLQSNSKISLETLDNLESPWTHIGLFNSFEEALEASDGL